MKYDLDPKTVGKWTGDKEFHEKVDLNTNVDKTGVTGGSISAHMSGDDGAKTREELDKLVGVHEKDVGDVKPSGEWTVSAEIPKEMMKDELLGKGGKNSTPSIQARAEAKEFADSKDNWQRKVQDIASYGERDPKLNHMKLDWNVELKGDPNFAGAAGRAQNQQVIEKLKADLDCSSGDPKVVGDVEKEVQRLRTQRNAVDPVTNPDQYKDLPLVLRQNELAHIDADLAQLQDLRHRALVEANKTKPSETPEELKARLDKDKGKDDQNKSPMQRLLDDARDQIALTDAEIAADDKVSDDKLYALDINQKDFNSGRVVNYRHAAEQSNKDWAKEAAEGRSAYQQHLQAMKGIDDQRVLLMKLMVDPAAALPFAYGVLGQLKREAAAAAAARAFLEQANDDINKLMGNDDDQDKEDAADDADAAKANGPTAMAL
jgi:hypothetical protein